MNESEEISQNQAKISKLAITSLILGLFGPLWGFLVLIICFALLDYDSIFLGFAAAFSYLIIWLPAHLIGQKAIRKISTSKGLLRGAVCAKAGMTISIGWALLLPFLFILNVFFCAWIHPIAPRMICGSHLSEIGKNLLIYSKDHGSYPNADQWCDALLQDTNMSGLYLKCPDNKKVKCSYSMNPYCVPNSEPNTVLVFESKGGWNSSSGHELLITNRHKEGSNFLFNDGHVKFVETDPNDQFRENLNWGKKAKAAD